MSDRRFKDEKTFKDTFTKYIKKCKEKEELPNIAGFCVFCDMHRDTFYAQEEYYSDTFKKIQDILENATINARINDTFKIFYLKNKFGYKDKAEIENYQIVLLELTKAKFCDKKELRDWMEIFNAKILNISRRSLE